MAKSNKYKRILCLDGGGIKGVFPAAFLAFIEEKTGKSIASHFDLIAGTSTGGIIALGLSLGIPAKDILNFYKIYGPRIFAGSTSSSLTWREGFRTALHQISTDWGWTGSKYNSDYLREALHDILGDRRIGDSQTRLVIPSYKSETHSLHVYKTAHHERLESDFVEPMVDVALATAAAPTYFKAHSYSGGSGLVDGGIWANNPAGIAAVEAVGMLGWPSSEIRMLSLGCSEQFLKPNKSVGMLGALWNGWILQLMFRGQDRGSMGTAKILLSYPHQNPNLYRVNPQLSSEYSKLDNVAIINGLIGIANSEGRSYITEIRKVFFEKEKEEFVPVHK